jgi:secondary thiamine-phosphate synthase enzyme
VIKVTNDLVKYRTAEDLSMGVVTGELEIRTKAENDAVGITKDVQKAVKESGLKNGIATVFVPGSTAAVTAMEYEPGLVHDFPSMLERVSPSNIPYEHQKTWHDDNGRSHVKASLVGPSLSVPFVDGLLTLGTWQQIVFVELDIRPRARMIVVQMVGE